MSLKVCHSVNCTPWLSTENSEYSNINAFVQICQRKLRWMDKDEFIQDYCNKRDRPLLSLNSILLTQRKTELLFYLFFFLEWGAVAFSRKDSETLTKTHVWSKALPCPPKGFVCPLPYLRGHWWGGQANPPVIFWDQDTINIEMSSFCWS